MLTININSLLITTFLLFVIGLAGVIFNRKNILITIMSIELLLLAVNLNFTTFSIYLDDIVGQVFVLFILTIAATESAIGLSIITTFYRLKNSIQLTSIKKNPTNKI
jgi:NADH-quinone oxidoreductase subunit K